MARESRLSKVSMYLGFGNCDGGDAATPEGPGQRKTPRHFQMGVGASSLTDDTTISPTTDVDSAKLSVRWHGRVRPRVENQVHSLTDQEEWKVERGKAKEALQLGLGSG